MALFQCNVYSNVLGMEVAVNVIIPQTTVKKIGTSSTAPVTDIPVLYLLHGMGGNETVWLRKTSIERYATAAQLAVIFPATDLAWYTDTTYDLRYWTYLSEELPQLMQQFFPTLTTKREKTFVGGLSMGGYGACKWALLQPERFGKAIVLSAPLVLQGQEALLLETRDRAYWEGIFGPLADLANSCHDPFTWVREFSKTSPKPEFFVACGTEDPLHPAGAYYQGLLQKAGFTVDWQEGPGGHEWQFWDTWIQKALAWLAVTPAKEEDKA